MKKRFFPTGIYFLLFLASCLQEEEIDRNYPLVKTNPVTDITSKGAQFSAAISYPDLGKITTHGFLWSEDQKFLTSVNTLLLDSLTDKTFFTAIGAGLVDKKTYYVRAFAGIAGKTVYGDIVSFRSLGSEGPKITSIHPETAAFGDTITVVGRNFSTDDVLLQFGSMNISADILQVQENSLTFKLPRSVPVDPPQDFISISIEGNITTSPKPLKLDLDRILLKIISISPLTLKACDTVTVTGKNFTNGDSEIVLTDSEKQLTILSSSANHVTGILKSLPPGELIFMVSNGRFSQWSDHIDLIEARPEVVSLSPSTYTREDIITVKVKNFPFCDNSVAAYVQGTWENLQVIAKSADEIKIQLPKRCFGVFAINFVIPGSYGQQIIETSPLTPVPPEIYSITPLHASLNDEVIITGKNLKGAVVNFLRDTTTTDTQIKGKVMETSAPGGVIDVNVDGCGGTLIVPNGFSYDPIEIIDFNPKIITSPSQEITISGKNFSSDFYYNNVTIGSTVYSNVGSVNNTITVSASALIPDGATERKESVLITVQNATGMTGTSTTMLVIDHEKSWFKMNDLSGLPAYGVNFVIAGKGYSGIGNFNTYGTRKFLEYEPASDTWTEKAPYPGQIATYYPFKVGVSSSGKGYVGLDEAYHDEWWQYDPSLDLWTKKANYPGSQPTIGNFAFELNGLIYIGGGGVSANEFWQYDPSGDSWIRKADLPIYAGRGNAGVGFKGKGYVYGTVLNSSTYLECAYDQGSDTWTTRQLGDYAQVGNMSMVFDDFVIIAGEHEPSRTRNTFLKIIPGSGNLEPVSYAGVARRGQFAFAIGDYGYFGSGIDMNTFYHSEEIWKFDPSKF